MREAKASGIIYYLLNYFLGRYIRFVAHNPDTTNIRGKENKPMAYTDYLTKPQVIGYIAQEARESLPCTSVVSATLDGVWVCVIDCNDGDDFCEALARAITCTLGSVTYEDYGELKLHHQLYEAYWIGVADDDGYLVP